MLKPCQYCGEDFAPPTLNARYCPDCRCPRRGGLNPRKRWRTKNCKHCGVEFQTKRRETKFCSLSCTGHYGTSSPGYAEWRARKRLEIEAREEEVRKRRAEERPLRLERAVYRYWTRRQGIFERIASLQEKRRLLQTPKECLECGGVFTASLARKVYCSTECNTRNKRRRHKQVRRARLKGSRVEDVSAFRVFERDAWRCQLCLVKTPRKLRGTLKDNAPELDHIIPLSRGGEHSYRNTQCACRKCNGDKGNEIRGQIPMFA